LRRWCGYKLEPKENDPTRFDKPPYSPVNGSKIGHNATKKNPRGEIVKGYESHWLTFSEATAGAKKHGLHGVGFVFCESDGYVGIDFDHCRNPETGHIFEAVRDWREKWFSTAYSEVSVSGTGVHIICRGTIPHSVKGVPLPKGDGCSVEIYSDSRFFVTTGWKP